MGKVIVLAVVLSGCVTFGDDDAIGIDYARPDALETVVYPCSLLDDTCKAAYEVAKANCARKERCDGADGGDRCIASEMEALCTEVTCYADGAYPRWNELNDCLFAFQGAYCIEPAQECHL